MNIKIRRVIMSIFILFFVITAPLLVLYASGFRYDFTRGRIQRTGNIFIEARSVRNATIYLDESRYKRPLNDSVLIKNLIPGEYKVGVEKEDRFRWEKTIRVNAGFTSFIKDIVLFFDAEPIQLVDEEIDEMKTAHEENIIVYTVTQDEVTEIHAYSIDDGSSEIIYRTSEGDSLEMTFSPSEKYLLLTTETQQLYLDPKEPDSITVLPDAQKIRWNSLRDELLLINPSEVTTLSPTDQTEATLYTSEDPIQDVFGVSSNYYIIKNTPDGSLILEYNKNLDDSIEIESLTTSSSYEFISADPVLLMVSNTNNQKLYVIKNPRSLQSLDFQITTLQFSARNALLSPNKQRILLYDNFELQYYDMNSRQLNLIDRFSTPIKDVLWYPDSNHIIITTESSIIISDLSTHEETSQITILENAENIISPSLEEDDHLYYGGNIDGNEGIFIQRIF